jgi:hypothetical protein
VPCHEDPCGLRLPALPCGYCYAPRTRTPRTSPQVARRAGKKSSAAQTSALDARHGMAKKKHATPHAMHMGNDLLLDVDRTIDKKDPLSLQAPVGKCNRPGEDGHSGHLVIIGPGLAAERETTYPSSKNTEEKRRKANWPCGWHQSDSAIVHCLMLGCAGQLVRFGYPMYLVDLGTGYPSVPRVSGMVVVIWRLLSSLNCALSVDILHALQPDEGRYAPLTRIRPPNYTVPPPSSTKY